MVFEFYFSTASNSSEIIHQNSSENPQNIVYNLVKKQTKTTYINLFSFDAGLNAKSDL